MLSYVVNLDEDEFLKEIISHVHSNVIVMQAEADEEEEEEVESKKFNY